MSKSGVGLLVAAAVLADVALTHAEVDGTRSERDGGRPYIVEVGVPFAISMEELRQEASGIPELRDCLQDYGSPDYAEIQPIEPEWPWAPSEVRVYYLLRNLQLRFAHLGVTTAAPNLGVMVFRGGIPREKVQQIHVALHLPAQPGPAIATGSGGVEGEALVARLEASAERAEQAADEAVAQSEAAVLAADRTENIVRKITQRARRR
jgi:hypothetical protein